MSFIVFNTNLIIAVCFLVGCGRDEKKHSSADETKGRVVPSFHQQELSHKTNQPKPFRSVTEAINEESLPVKRHEILKDIEDLIGRPVSSLTSAEWRSIKQHYWTPSLDRSVPKPASGTVCDLTKNSEGKESSIVQIATGNFTDIGDPAEQEFLVATHLLAMATASQGGAFLPEAIEDRIKDRNITRGDVYLAEVLSDAFVEVIGRQQLSQASRDNWQSLANSPNDLYRLLALRTFRRVEPDPKEWISFYRGYLKDTDHGIIEEATSLVFQTGLPEAADLLSEFRAACTDVDRRDRLDQSIEWLNRQHSPKKD